MKRKLTAIITAIFTLVLSVTTVYAEDTFEGWDDETKEDAWSVLAITDWTEIQDRLILDNSISQSATAIDISNAVRDLENDVKNVLEESSANTRYSKESYVEIMLAMIQVLSDGKPSATDPCNIKKYIDGTVVNLTKTKSIKKLFQTFVFSENAYNSAFETDANLYSNDSYLQSVIQGVMLGSSYSASNEEYDSYNALQFYNNNKARFDNKKVIPSTTFASDVSSYYQTTFVSGGYSGNYSGKVTDDMQKIVDVATNNTGTYPCTPDMCAAWVTGVYAAAGYSTVPYGNAIDMWNNYSSTGSTSMDNIPPGAIVLGSGVGSAGSIYGHSGVYLGNGMVANNVGRHSIEPLDSWCSWQSATCQGHTGWIGWVFPGGVPQ